MFDIAAIKDTCTENEFACCAMPQSCIHVSKRCDGHPDCADGEDENNCRKLLITTIAN